MKEDKIDCKQFGDIIDLLVLIKAEVKTTIHSLEAKYDNLESDLYGDSSLCLRIDELHELYQEAKQVIRAYKRRRDEGQRYILQSVNIEDIEHE